MDTETTITLKNGTILTIREATKYDAEASIVYGNKVGGETDFLSFGLNEFNKTVDDQKSTFTDISKTNNTIFILGILDGTIVSMANISASQKARLQHVGSIGISVLKDYWKLGIGTAMMQTLINFSKKSGVIRKLKLVVSEDNPKALELYKKLGFTIDGKVERDFYINGKFSTGIYMGLFIDP